MTSTISASSETVLWTEGRNGELFFVEAEKDSDGSLRFYERSTYEVKWYDCVSTPERIKEAQELFGEQSERMRRV
jgi:hypothetical protein